MDVLEEFKANAKGAWVDGRIVGAYAKVQGYVLAMTPDLEVEVFEENKYASRWLKERHNAKTTDQGDTKH